MINNFFINIIFLILLLTKIDIIKYIIKKFEIFLLKYNLLLLYIFNFHLYIMININFVIFKLFLINTPTFIIKS